MSNNTIDKLTYMHDSRFEALRNQGVSYEDFSANQTFYMNKLSKTSIMSLEKEGLYEKGKALYETYTNMYNQQNNVFIQYKNKLTANKEQYDNLIKQFELQNQQQLAKNGKSGSFAATDAQKNSAISQSGYTTALINATNDAELSADLLLDKRFQAVDMQRRGIMT